MARPSLSFGTKFCESLVRRNLALGLTVITILGVLVIWTAPNRWGVGIALHYISRMIWPDPADPIPPKPA